MPEQANNIFENKHVIEIRSVIRSFRWLGWIGAIIYAPMVFIPLFSFFRSLFVEINYPPWFFALVVLFNGVIFIYILACLRTASNLKKQNPEAIKAGRILSCIMMIGVPIFTLIGVLLLRKLDRHYLDYCLLDLQESNTSNAKAPGAARHSLLD